MLLLCFTYAPAHAQCASPAGVEGQIVYNSTSNVPQYCDGTNNWVAMVGAEEYKVNAVEFDGVNDYLLSGGGLIGGADGTEVTGYGWFKRDSTSSQIIYANTGSGFRLRFNLSDEFSISGENAAGTVILDVSSIGTYTDSDWHSFLFSFDITDTSKRHLYIDDTDVLNVNVYNTAGGALDFDTTNHAVGANTGGGTPFAGGVSDLWLDYGTYINLSVEANRRKFINSSGMPVFLGLNGINPTGVQPDIFLSGDTANWHTNKGTGGGFTENGALTTSYTYPGGGTQIVPSGLIGHWRLDETSGTTIFDSSGNGYDGSLNSVSLPAASTYGLIDKAIDFNDTGHVAVAANSTFPTVSQVTIAVWVKPHDIAGANLDGFFTVDGMYDILVGNNSNEIQFGADAWDTSNGSWTTNSVDPLQAEKWTHFAVTYDYSSTANAPVFYVNGELVGANQNVAPSGIFSPPATAPLRIGERNNASSSDFNGLMDDVRYYNRILTADEVHKIYQARDGLRYNGNQRTLEYFDGNKFAAVTPAWGDVDNGLVGHWKLDEISYSSAADSSSNGNAGALAGGLDQTNDSAPGAVGPALSFDGVDDSIQVSNTYTHPVTSLSVWFKPTVQTTDGHLAMHYQDSSNSWGLEIQSAGSVNVREEFAGVPVAHYSTPVTLGAWHHAVTIITDTNESLLYLDGALVGSGTVLGGNLSNLPTANFYIGQRGNNTEYLKGMLDDVRIYNRALSPSEVQTLYAMGAPVGTSTALPQGCPNIGDVCDDGTVYAGQHNYGAGNVNLYVSQYEQASGAQWSTASGNDDITTEDSDDGWYNNINLNSALTNFPAFELCRRLHMDNPGHASGYDDWYLPAINELAELKSNAAAISANAVDNFSSASTYWSSTEGNLTQAVGYSTASFNVSKTSSTPNVRCVRKGPAPRCANPYGVEGQIVYNTTFDAVQYCDGARWRAVGKLE